MHSNCLKILLFFILCRIFAESAFAQQSDNSVPANSSTAEIENFPDKDIESPHKRRKQCAYIEFGGAGLLYSLNYDTRFRGGKGLGISVGVSAIGIFPAMLNYLFDLAETDKHHIELGLGVDIAPFLGLLPFAVAGYRYRSAKGLLFRACITPVYKDKDRLPVLCGGISFGFAF